MKKLFCLVSLCFCIYLAKSQNNIECKQILGTIASNGNNSTSNCDDGYTLLSCGINGTGMTPFSGIIIDDSDTCIAVSNNNAGFGSVQSVGQCCNLTNIQITNDNCTTRISSDINDGITNISCLADTMFGCSYYSINGGNNMDSSCTSNIINDNCNNTSHSKSTNYCIAIDGSMNGVINANARCCSSTIKTECINVWSSESALIANVSCSDDGYFMSGCSGYHNNPGESLTGFYIQDNNCIAHGTQSVYAIGICCKFVNENQEESQNDTTALFIIIGTIFGLISIIILFFVLKTCCDAKKSFAEDSEAVSRNIDNKNVTSPSEYDGVLSNKLNDDDIKDFTPGKMEPNRYDQNIIEFTPRGHNDFTENKEQININDDPLVNYGHTVGNILSNPMTNETIGNDNNKTFETPAGLID